MRTLRLRACRATYSSWAIPRIAYCGWSGAPCASRMRTANRRRYRSGWARRRAVSRLRKEIEQRLDGGRAADDGRAAKGSSGEAMQWLIESVGLDEAAALQIIQYLSAGRAALGCLPTFDTVIFERFFDESGG